jgi:glycosyltransferase involved in cell wall biosynthesis
MRVLWTHNFPPHRVSSGVFMHTSLGELKRQGVDVDLYHTGNLRNPIELVRAIRSVSRKARNYDVVHAQFGSACAWVTSFVQQPKIVTLRGSDYFGIEAGPFLMRVHGWLGRRFTFRSIESYSKVIVQSRQMRRLLAARFPRTDFEVMPSGIDLTRFTPIPRKLARARLGQGNDTRPWILQVALRDSNPVKRWALGKSAADIVVAKRPDVVLKSIAGISHDQMALWMNAADVLLLTSTHEGWPNVVKEALACNTPFVSTDVSDLGDIASIEPSCQVTDASPRALADALLSTLSSPRPTNLWQHVQEMEVGKVVQRITRLYHEACGIERDEAPRAKAA